MYNPISGRGRSAAAAEALRSCLADQGHEAITLASRLDSTDSWLTPALKNAGLLIVAGGDGAMRMAAPAACHAGVPVYHLPLGTENLFAREFGMTKHANTLLSAIERWRIRDVDVGIANGRMFLLMASVGFDAEVVHVLAGSRASSISHFSYVRPILASMRTWRPQRLSIEADGRTRVDQQRGMVVIANSRQYGWRIDPAVNARMDDGLLDVVFFPATSLRQLVGWVIRCRLRRQHRHRNLVSAQGREIVVRCAEPMRFQLDGDPPGKPTDAVWMTGDATDDGCTLRCAIGSSRLRVLTASDGP